MPQPPRDSVSHAEVERGYAIMQQSNVVHPNDESSDRVSVLARRAAAAQCCQGTRERACSTAPQWLTLSHRVPSAHAVHATTAAFVTRSLTICTPAFGKAYIS